MKIYTGCVPCFARQAVEAAEMSTDDQELRHAIIREALHALAEIPYEKTPPHAGVVIHRIVKNMVGNIDPYLELKTTYNRRALDLYPEMKETVARSSDRFETAVRLAIAGNNIDFGIRSNSDHIDLHDVIDETLGKPLTINITCSNLMITAKAPHHKPPEAVCRIPRTCGHDSLHCGQRG